ncbi:MAG: type II toxin-antitoxin system RelE/ParE family toxin [Pleurocapsa sp. SU_196_0]|nr:type II toxin-antitoxin system RelE/ParE family toxin [Pleurocapsa sp. SU_196_0]
MTVWVSIRREALEDIEHAQMYFAGINADLENRFRLEIERTVEQLQTFPESHQKILGDVRRVLLRHFYYALYYTIQIDAIEIIAVLDTRRDPSRWQSRISAEPDAGKPI